MEVIYCSHINDIPNIKTTIYCCQECSSKFLGLAAASQSTALITEKIKKQPIQRYEIQHFDYANGGRSWHVYDNIEHNYIHTATCGFLKEDKSCPESVVRICDALNRKN